MILNSLTIQDRETEWHLNFISVTLFTFSSVYYSMIYFSAFLTEDFIDLCIWILKYVIPVMVKDLTSTGPSVYDVRRLETGKTDQLVAVLAVQGSRPESQSPEPT